MKRTFLLVVVAILLVCSACQSESIYFVDQVYEGSNCLTLSRSVTQQICSFEMSAMIKDFVIDRGHIIYASDKGLISAPMLKDGTASYRGRKVIDKSRMVEFVDVTSSGSIVYAEVMSSGDRAIRIFSNGKSKLLARYTEAKTLYGFRVIGDSVYILCFDSRGKIIRINLATGKQTMVLRFFHGEWTTTLNAYHGQLYVGSLRLPGDVYGGVFDPRFAKVLRVDPKTGNCSTVWQSALVKPNQQITWMAFSKWSIVPVCYLCVLNTDNNAGTVLKIVDWKTKIVIDNSDLGEVKIVRFY